MGIPRNVLVDQIERNHLEKRKVEVARRRIGRQNVTPSRAMGDRTVRKRRKGIQGTGPKESGIGRRIGARRRNPHRTAGRRPIEQNAGRVDR